MTRRDPAVLFYGSDFFDDEHVLRMSYEDQGVYQRLLWISLRNFGLPADPAAIAELLALPFRGLTVKRFLAVVWPRIAPCWTAIEGGRLIQRRQEEERERREASKGRDDSGSADDGVRTARSERMRQVALARWGDRQKDAADASASDAHAYAPRIAPRIAARNADADAPRNASASLPPAPPSVQSKRNQPQPAHARAHGADALRNADADAGRTADAQAAVDPAVQVQKALLATSLRSGMRGLQRSRALLEVAEQLLPTGITPEHVRSLWDVAQRKAKSTTEDGEVDPGGLLQHWLLGDGGGGGWREVLDEQAMKDRESAPRQSEPADILSGIYGE